MTKVLFIALSGIGNYLMQAPTIAAYRKIHPNAHITVWVAPRGTKVLAENDSNVDEVIEMPIKQSILGHILQLSKIRKHKFDEAIVLSPGQLVKSAAYMFFAGIPSRIGNTYPLGSDPSSSRFLTRAVEEKEKTHDVIQNLLLLGNSEAVSLEKTYTLSIPASAMRQAKIIMQEFHIPEGSPIVGIHAGSGKDLAFKRWPIERFAEVATGLIKQHGVHIVLLGGKEEAEQKQFLSALIEEKSGTPAAVHTVSADLLATAAIMQMCTLMIASDTGLMHLASAAGTPVLGLFGPTDEALTGPVGKNATVIRAPNTKPIYTTEAKQTLGTEPHSSILAITPQMVLEAAQGLLRA